MSDGSISGAVAEGVKGIVGGTVKTAVQEVKNVPKTLVTQTAGSSHSQTSQNNQNIPQPEPGKDQKIAQIRSSLHNEMIKVTPQPTQSDPNQPRGPIAEQSFGKSTQQPSGFTSTQTQTKKIDYAVRNARSEHGRNAKG